MKHIAVAIGWLLLSAAAARGDVTVPAWFKSGGKNPYLVYEAWRELSTREASISITRGSLETPEYIAAGRLVDEQGEPIADCPLTVWYMGSRMRSAQLRSDANGYFILYGVWNRLVAKSGRDGDASTRGMSFSASPGYPHSWFGRLYAKENGDVRACAVSIAYEEADRSFCYVTCSRRSRFDAAEFKAFRRRVAASILPKPSYYSMLKVEPVAERDRTTTLRPYRVRVVTPKGEPVAHAYIQANDPMQTVETDLDGEAVLELWSNQDVSSRDVNVVLRALAVDVPGYSSGPAYTALHLNQTTDIAAQPAGRVTGRMVDWNGEPACVNLTIEYDEPNLRPRYLNPRLIAGGSQQDGSFLFDWVMPGRRFRVVLDPTAAHVSQEAPAASAWMTVKPGEHRDIGALTLTLAAALRVVVLDEATGVRVSGAKVELIVGGERVATQDARTGLACFSGVTPGAVQVRVMVKGYADFLSEAVTVEAGEVRVLRVGVSR